MGTDGRPVVRWMILLLACGFAGLGWFLTTGALFGLGILLPYTTYSYNFQFDTLVTELTAGVGLILVGLASLVVFRRALAAWTLAGLLLILFGMTIALEACDVTVVTPVGSASGSICDPWFTLTGFALTGIGAAMIVSGILRFLAARARRPLAATARPPQDHRS